MHSRFAVVVLVAVPLIVGRIAAQETNSDKLLALPTYSEEDVELTEQKVQTLSDEMHRLGVLTQVLKDLGSPAEKQDGEDSAAYVERVDTTMKARGLAVHLMHQQLEKALDAKFQLEVQLDEYEQWIKRLEAAMPQMLEQYRQQEAVLDNELTELRRDGMVLASLLHANAVAAGEDDEAKRYQIEFTDDFGNSLLDSLPDLDARRSKFSGLSGDELGRRYAEIEQQVVDKDFERRLLVSHQIPETEGLADLLPEEHYKMLKDAREALAASKDLEDRAAQVSIIGRYVFDNLQLINQFPDVLRKLVVIRTKVVPSVPQMEQAIDVLVGGRLRPTGRRGIMRPSSGSPNDVYREN